MFNPRLAVYIELSGTSPRLNTRVNGVLLVKKCPLQLQQASSGCSEPSEGSD